MAASVLGNWSRSVRGLKSCIVQCVVSIRPVFHPENYTVHLTSCITARTMRLLRKKKRKQFLCIFISWFSGFSLSYFKLRNNSFRSIFTPKFMGGMHVPLSVSQSIQSNVYLLLHGVQPQHLTCKSLNTAVVCFVSVCHYANTCTLAAAAAISPICFIGRLPCHHSV